jgi:hypothetical protein
MNGGLSVFVHVRAFNKASLDAGTRVGQLFAAIVLDALAPDAFGTLGVETGNPGATSVGQINADAAILVEQVQRERPCTRAGGSDRSNVRGSRQGNPDSWIRTWGGVRNDLRQAGYHNGDLPYQCARMHCAGMHCAGMLDCGRRGRFWEFQRLRSCSFQSCLLMNASVLKANRIENDGVASGSPGKRDRVASGSPRVGGVRRR